MRRRVLTLVIDARQENLLVDFSNLRRKNLLGHHMMKVKTLCSAKFARKRGEAAAQESCCCGAVPKESMWKLWNLIVTYHHVDFPNLTTLARLCLTLAVHTAGCERGFSVQNSILTSSRNRLTPGVQQKLMRSKLGPGRSSFNFSAALTHWRQ